MTRVSLIGPVFLDGVIFLTLAAFAGLVWVWPRLGRRTTWGVLGRVGSLLLVNLLVLLTAFTQMNATYLFFANWADLAGAISGHVVQSSLDRGASAAVATTTKVRHGAHARVAKQVPALTKAAGTYGLLSYTIHGPLSGLTGNVTISLPPGYSRSAAATQRYPVLEAFGGYPGTLAAWAKVMPMPQELDFAARTHHISYPILVQPEVEFPSGVDTEGVNGTGANPQVETWLARDVPDWLAQNFRVQQDRQSWATIGYSTGGFIAGMAALLHPAQFGAAIVLGGYFRPDFGPYYEPYSTHSALARRYDLPALVKKHSPPVAMWVETSHADPLSYSTSSQFLESLHSPLSVHAVVLQNAGHRLGVWRALLPAAVQWLGATVPGFRYGSHGHADSAFPPSTPSVSPTASPTAGAPRRHHRSRIHRPRVTATPTAG